MGKIYPYKYDDILVKAALTSTPIKTTAAVIAKPTPATIRPYSIAVAPSSSDKYCLMNLHITSPFPLPFSYTAKTIIFCKDRKTSKRLNQENRLKDNAFSTSSDALYPPPTIVLDNILAEIIVLNMPYDPCPVDI